MPRKGRQFTTDQKLKILEEARQPNTTVAEVLRRHQVDAPTFYRWEKVAKQAVRDAFDKRPAHGTAAKDREIERLREELTKKRQVIAEVVEENLQLKKTL